MQKIDNKKLITLFVLLLVSGLFVIKEYFFQSSDVPQSVEVSVSNQEEEVSESESTSATSPRSFVVRNEAFRNEIEIAYRQQDAVIWARDFIILYYQFDGNVPSIDTFTPYVDEKFAQAIIKEKEGMANEKIVRTQRTTDFSILSETPLKIRFNIIGTLNGQPHQAVYELILNESKDQIISLIQVQT